MPIVNPQPRAYLQLAGELMLRNDELRVTIQLRRRPDGGLRAWSDELPGLVLSHRDPAKVMADIIPAVEIIASEILGAEVTAHAVNESVSRTPDSPLRRAELLHRLFGRSRPVEVVEYVATLAAV